MQCSPLPPSPPPQQRKKLLPRTHAQGVKQLVCPSVVVIMKIVRSRDVGNCKYDQRQETGLTLLQINTTSQDCHKYYALC